MRLHTLLHTLVHMCITVYLMLMCIPSADFCTDHIANAGPFRHIIALCVPVSAFAFPHTLPEPMAFACADFSTNTKPDRSIDSEPIIDTVLCTLFCTLSCTKWQPNL